MVPAIGRLPISGACAWLAGFKVRRHVRSRSSGVLVSPNSSGPRNDGGVVSNRYSNAACRADPWVTRQQIGRSIGRCQGDRRTAARADGKLFEATLVNAVAAGVLKRKLTTIIDWSPVHGAGAVADTCELIRGLLRKWSEPAARRWLPMPGGGGSVLWGQPDIDWQDPVFVYFDNHAGCDSVGLDDHMADVSLRRRHNRLVRPHATPTSRTRRRPRIPHQRPRHPREGSRLAVAPGRPLHPGAPAGRPATRRALHIRARNPAAEALRTRPLRPIPVAP